MPVETRPQQRTKLVLLTGAAGDVGGRLRKLLKPVYPGLRLSDIKALTRWLDPGLNPRIVMGPAGWVKQRY